MTMDQSTTIRNLQALGIKTPSALTKAAAVADAIQEWNRPKTDPILDLRGRLENGEIEPKALGDILAGFERENAIREYCRGKASALNRGVSVAVRNALKGHAEKLLSEMNPIVLDAEATIKATKEALGDSPDPAALARMGPAVVAQWEVQREAVATLDTINALRFDLFHVGYGRGAATIAWYLAEPLTPARMDAAEQAGKFGEGGGSMLARLVYAGFSVRCNTVEEQEQIEAGNLDLISSEEAVRAAAADDADERSKQLAVNWDRFANSAIARQAG